MSAAVVIVVLVVLMAVVVAVKSIATVPDSHAGIVERFGRYQATLPAGRGVVVPFVDAVRHTVDLREQACTMPGRPVVTEDEVTVSVDLVLHFRVIDPVLATYEISDYRSGLEMLALTVMRRTLAGMTMEQGRAEYRQIESTLRHELARAGAAWGLGVTRVVVEQIGHASPSRDADVR